MLKAIGPGASESCRYGSFKGQVADIWAWGVGYLWRLQLTSGLYRC